MNRIYKYVLTIFIVLAAGFLTYQHYTDPIYQLKVGTTINNQDDRIEDWGGRFQITDGEIFIGFKTRLEPGTTIHMNVVNEDINLFNYNREFYVTPSYQFYFDSTHAFMFGPGTYKVTISVDGEVLETTKFIIEELEVEE